MATVSLLNYDEAPEEVQKVFDEIKAARDIPDVNNFWKALAHDPVTLRRVWNSLSQVMKPGALDPLTKEMLYIAVSIANNCEYCIHSHTAAARAKGMTETQYAELLAVVSMASQTNALVTGMKVPVDEDFLVAPDTADP
ncbi:MAG: carboxymuconolactone decarboxylase family protein [Gammaproteobacteria bacterium]|nr:carboxymuconolactone decarboxylase family protein [Gammaproteobacteria bacterium]